MTSQSEYLDRAKNLSVMLRKRGSDVVRVETEKALDLSPLDDLAQKYDDLVSRVSDLEQAVLLAGEIISNIDANNSSSSANVMTRVRALEQRFTDLATAAREIVNQRGGARR